MTNEEQTAATVEVPAHAAGHGGAPPPLIDVSIPLASLTLVTFIIMVVVLAKFAWKPILKALEDRENSIRKALEDAEKARKDLAESEAKRREVLAEAERKARDIVEYAKASAATLAAELAQKSRDEAKEIVESAHKEIGAAVEKARLELRRESSDLAIRIAEKILKENIDSSKNRELAERLVKDLANADK